MASNKTIDLNSEVHYMITELLQELNLENNLDNFNKVKKILQRYNKI